MLIVLVAAILSIIIKPSPPRAVKDSTYIPEVADTCSQVDPAHAAAYTCYTKEINSVTQKYNPETATALLKKQYSQVSYVKGDCHQLMHVVGRAAYAKYGNLADAFAHGDQFCWSGFYHGIMEELSREKGYNYIFAHASTLCSQVAKKYGQYAFNTYNCVHGLGHGFMELEDENLFDALKSCDAFKNSWDAQSCYGGVFMQNVMNVQGPEGEDLATYKYLKADDPMYPCDAVANQYKGSCYLMQTSFALQVDNYDFNKVFAQCADVQPQPLTNICYQSLGRDASGQSISDVTKTKDTCMLGPDLEAQENCFTGAVKDFVSYFHSDKKGYELCAAAPPVIKQSCNYTVKQYFSTF